MGPAGCPWWVSGVVTLYVEVFHVRGVPPPLGVGAFFCLVLFILTLVVFDLLSIIFF